MPIRQGAEQISLRLRLLHSYLSQLAAVLMAAHTHQVVHGALVPGNVLLKNPGQVWVADFGLARLSPPPSALPPELQEASPDQIWELMSPATDQYMLAVFCQHLLTRWLPWPQYQTWHSVLQRALDANPQRRYESVEQLMYLLLEWIVSVAREPGQGKPPGHPASVSPTLRSLPYPDQAKVTGNLSRSVPERAKGGGPETAALVQKRAEQAILHGDFSLAATLYLQLVQGGHEHDAALWTALGDASVALEHYDQALWAYEQAIVCDPNDPQTWENRGVALEALGQSWEAADSHERAKQLRAEQGR